MENKLTKAELAVQKSDTKRIGKQAEETVAQADIERLASERTSKLINAWDTDIPNDEDALLRGGIHGLNVSAATLARTGLFFLKLKETHWKRQFVEKLAEHDIPQRQVYNAMSVATAMLKLPKAKFAMIANFNGSQLIELAKLPQETLEAAFETGILNGDKLDDIAQMSVRELQNKLRQERDEHKKSDEIKDQLLEDKSKQIDAIATEFEKAKGNIVEGEDSPTVQAIKANGMQTAGSIILLRNQADRLAQTGGEADVYEVAALSGALQNLRIELALAFERLEAACPAYQAHLEGAAVDMNSWKSGVDIPADMKL